MRGLKSLRLDDLLLDEAFVSEVLSIRNWETLSIRTQGIPQNIIERLSTIHNLRRLTIWNDYAIRLIETLSRCQQLEHLSFKNCEIPSASADAEDGLRQLSRLPKLAEMHFVDCDFLPNSMSGIGNLKHLRRLKFIGSTTIESNDVQALREINELSDLAVHTQLRPADFASLAQLTNLRRLSVRMSLKQVDTKAFAQQRSINDLDLGFTDVTESHLIDLAKGKPLRALNLQECRNISSAGILALGDFPDLEVLNLSDTAVDDEIANFLRGCAKLKSANFCYTRVGGGVLRQLAKKCDLEFLWLAHVVGIQDSDVELLSDCPKLTKLFIQSCGLNGRFLAKLSTLPSLKIFDVGDNKEIDDNDLAPLAISKSLHSLWVDFTELTSESLKALTEVQTLRHISGYGCDWSVETVGKLELSNFRLQIGRWPLMGDLDRIEGSAHKVLSGEDTAAGSDESI